MADQPDVALADITLGLDQALALAAGALAACGADAAFPDLSHGDVMDFLLHRCAA